MIKKLEADYLPSHIHPHERRSPEYKGGVVTVKSIDAAASRRGVLFVPAGTTLSILGGVKEACGRLKLPLSAAEQCLRCMWSKPYTGRHRFLTSDFKNIFTPYIHGGGGQHCCYST